MNNGLKALLIAASTIITCIIVGLGFTMAREARQIGNHVVEEMNRYRITVEEQDYIKYDGVTVYGNDVVNLMKKELLGDVNELSITVEDGSGTYTYQTAEDVKRVQQPESGYYIVPTAEYLGNVVKNRNEVIVELKFIKK